MILVTGASGFVGSTVLKFCRDTVACPSLQNLSEYQVHRLVEESGADVIIHTAAISDTGFCQSHPDASYQANVRLPLWLANAAKGRKLICFSSDQVYNGSPEDGPYTEVQAHPSSVYASHKLEMEERVLGLSPDAVMLRAEWMYDMYFKKSNFFMNLIQTTDSVLVSPKQYRGLTYVREVAENMERVIGLPGGIYNFGSETTQSVYQVTQFFTLSLGKNLSVEEGPPRHHLWMNCEKARKYGITFSSVEEGLLRCARDHGLLSSQDL
ncbi:MAG: NAD-dependent epimerase/dehydratase family protein [Ruminococcaceae bacterium]|nr:NAD-dependent epimerase/dehydratase family protein [Oscillospiraceae bacterium]